MEQTNPEVAKRLSNIIRVIFFMLRKGKLAFHFNSMIKRGKIAVINVISHHNHRHIAPSAPREYEFSCSNTHAPFPFVTKKRYSHFFACAQAPPTEDDDLVTANAVKMALEIFHSAKASPAQAESPWFGRSPAMRRLRVSDSPVPLEGVEEDTHVDEAAEEFILKFYRNLRKQDVLALQH